MLLTEEIMNWMKPYTFYSIRAITIGIVDVTQHNYSMNYIASYVFFLAQTDKLVETRIGRVRYFSLPNDET